VADFGFPEHSIARSCGYKLEPPKALTFKCLNLAARIYPQMIKKFGMQIAWHHHIHSPISPSLLTWSPNNAHPTRQKRSPITPNSLTQGYLTP
jgi:hypothetical protein